MFLQYILLTYLSHCRLIHKALWQPSYQIFFHYQWFNQQILVFTWLHLFGPLGNSITSKSISSKGKLGIKHTKRGNWITIITWMIVKTFYSRLWIESHFACDLDWNLRLTSVGFRYNCHQKTWLCKQYTVVGFGYLN